MNDSSPSIDLPTLEHEHREIVPIANAFSDELENQILRLLDDAGIKQEVLMESRVKGWDSVARKLQDEAPRFAKVTEIHDLVGLRLILPFKRDVTTACRLIEQNFPNFRRQNTQDRLSEDQFGYSSIHYEVEFPDEWLAAPTLNRFKGMVAEIQIRTVAQHNWAAASRILQYKNEASVPPIVRRSIHRVSALLETVDLEFERVLEQRDSYRVAIDAQVSDELLNVDLLEKTLDSLLPPERKLATEPFAILLDDLTYLGVRTPRQLETLVDSRLSDATSHEAYLVARIKSRESTNAVAPTLKVRIAKDMFFGHVGLVSAMLQAEFGEAHSDHRQDKIRLKMYKSVSVIAAKELEMALQIDEEVAINRALEAGMDKADNEGRIIGGCK